MMRPSLAVFSLVPLSILACGSQPAPSGATTGAGGSTTTQASSTSGGGGDGGGAQGGSSAGQGGGGAGGSAPSCPSCAEPVVVGTLASDKLNETSGIAASKDSPGIFYVHNDSGDKPRFFAINSGGAKVATFDLGSGATAIDWEDIAVGPCPTGSCVYLADTGDNLKVRASYTIYRVPEPALVADATLAAEAFPFTYPNGARDSEALFVHPSTGVVTVVTKTFGSSEVYELPPLEIPGKSLVAIAKGQVVLPIEPALVTAASAHPQGKGLLLRTYADAYFYPMAAGQSVADALQGKACSVPLAVEPQGEAIGWLPSGEGYLSVSEGAGAVVNLVNCPSP